MTRKEAQKIFPIGSLVKHTRDDVIGETGIVLGYREVFPDVTTIRIAWIIDEYDTIEAFPRVFPKDIQPVGEIEAVETLIDFASRLLETDLGRPDREKLENAIAKCEEIFGI